MKVFFRLTEQRRATLAIAGAAVVLLCVSWLLLGPFSAASIHARSFSKAAAAQQMQETVTLNALTDFSWESAYAFAPYMDRQHMASYMGVSSARLPQTVSEGMLQLVFVQDGRIVCAVTGYPERLGYDFRFPDREDGVFLITAEEQTVFITTEQNGINVYEIAG